MDTDRALVHTAEVGLARTILTVAATTALIASFVFSWNLPGIQFPLTILLVILGLAVLHNKAQRVMSGYHIGLLTITLVISIFVAVRSALALTVMNIGLTLFLLAVYGLELSWRRALSLFDYFIMTWLLPFIALPAMNDLIKNVRLKLTRQLTTTQRSVVRGIFFAVPVLLIFGVLFASADAVFANVFKQLFSFELSFSGEMIGRTVFAIAIFTFLAPILSYIFLSKLKPKPLEHNKLRSNYAIELSIVLGSLNALFLMFVIIHGVYLFGSRDFVLNGDITYAEYGRRGFFELLAVSLLVFSLAYAVKRFFDLSKMRLPQALLLSLIAQVGFIIVSALRRLGLYEDVFGFTHLRFYSHSFIFFLVAAFALLVYSVVANRSESMLLRGQVLLLGGYVLVLNIINPDAAIATRNLTRYYETGNVDYEYISSLSNDAIDQKIELFTSVQPDYVAKNNNPIRFRLAGEDFREWSDFLCLERKDLTRNEPWSVWNFSRDNAKDKLASFDCF